MPSLQYTRNRFPKDIWYLKKDAVIDVIKGVSIYVAHVRFEIRPGPSPPSITGVRSLFHRQPLVPVLHLFGCLPPDLFPFLSHSNIFEIYLSYYVNYFSLPNSSTRCGKQLRVSKRQLFSLDLEFWLWTRYGSAKWEWRLVSQHW